MTDPKERFTDRVSDYTKYRPGYPDELLDYLISYYSLNSHCQVADIGSGTGIFTKLLLDRGFTVYAVEPNEAMRLQAENDLKDYNCFYSINASAEDTAIISGTMDLVTACQAFHWFNKEKAKTEFRRILKKDGLTALIWNERANNTPFLKEYDAMLNTLPDYVKHGHKNIKEEDLAQFFLPHEYQIMHFENSQHFDLEGLKGRLSSSSYAPKEGDARYEEIFSRLEELYYKYNHHGIIDFNYDTVLYIGRV